MHLLPILAQLPAISDPSDLTSIFEQLVGQWLAIVNPYALEIFWALAALDVAVFGWNLWRHYGGDIRQAMLATANKVLIIGMFLALLMNGTVWITDIINSFITIGKRFEVAARTAGSGPDQFTYLVMKPTEPFLDTTMTVGTNKRPYYLRLVSTTTWMASQFSKSVNREKPHGKWKAAGANHRR